MISTQVIGERTAGWVREGGTWETLWRNKCRELEGICCSLHCTNKTTFCLSLLWILNVVMRNHQTCPKNHYHASRLL